MQLRLIGKSIEDCSMAIILRNGCDRLAYKLRAKLHLASKMYRQAIFDISSQLQLTSSTSIHRRRKLISSLEWTQRILVVKRVDNLYANLNLDDRASATEIRNNFKTMAISMHPGIYSTV